MIIDANAFIGKWPYWPVQADMPSQVVEELRGVSVDAAAICSTRAVFVNWPDGNDETEAAAQSYPEQLIPFACLGTQELSHALRCERIDFEGYAKRGFRGLRLYPQHHSYHLLFQPFVDEVLEDAQSRRWPVMLPLRIIMNWGMPMLELSVMHEVITRHPKVVWILAGVNYLHELQMATSLMLRFPNVFLETSCVMGYAAIEKSVQLCGHDQILYGSGAPLQSASAGFSKVMHSNISEIAREAILGRNFERILGGVKR